FSTAGKRKLNDPRNQLLRSAAELALSLDPQVILIENVNGALAGRHRRYWEQAHAHLRSGGYQTTDLLCDGVKLGIPQMRRRVVLFAWRGGGAIPGVLPDRPRRLLADALHGVEGLPNHEPQRLAPNS